MSRRNVCLGSPGVTYLCQTVLDAASQMAHRRQEMASRMDIDGGDQRKRGHFHHPRRTVHGWQGNHNPVVGIIELTVAQTIGGYSAEISLCTISSSTYSLSKSIDASVNLQAHAPVKDVTETPDIEGYLALELFALGR